MLFGFHFDIDAHDDQRTHCYSLDTLVAESLTNLSPSLTNLSSYTFHNSVDTVIARVIHLHPGQFIRDVPESLQ